MSETFPRLLVATEFAPASPGGGLVLIRQMLRGWPADKIFWWSCHAGRAGMEGQAVAGHFVAPSSSKLYPNRRFAPTRAWLMEKFWSPRAAAHLQRTLRECQPDVVWAIPQNWSIPPLAKGLIGGDIPFHVSLHDYPDLGNVVKRIGAGAAGQLAVKADALYARANSRDAICRPMLDDLEQRLGVGGALCRVGVEADDMVFLERKQPEGAAEICIAFAGTIIAESAFEVFVKALNGIRARLPRAVRLEFFGAHTQAQRSWFDAGWMRERRNLPDTDFRAALRECAWGAAPVSFANEDPRYDRFSFPAKVTSYFAAGLPVIALGHPASSLIELARRYDFGVCSTATDLETLQSELLAGLSQPTPWAKYADEVRRCVRSEFNAHEMRAALQESFRRAAATHSSRA